jgi:hypothetical protein
VVKKTVEHYTPNLKIPFGPMIGSPIIYNGREKAGEIT